MPETSELPQLGLLAQTDAARHARRRLIGAVAVAMLPALLLRTGIELVAIGKGAALVNGRLVTLGPPHEVFGWLILLGFLATWCVAIAAGFVIVAGAVRGVAVSVSDALRRGVERVVPVAVMVFLVGLAAAGLAWIGFAVLPPAFAHPLVIWPGLAAIALLVARLSLILPGVVFDMMGEPFGAWRLARGRVIRTCGAIVLGAMVAPWAIVALATRLGDSITEAIGLTGPGGIALAALFQVALDAAIVVAVAIQAGVVMTSCLDKKPGTVLADGVTVTGPVADLDVVDRALAENTLRSPGRSRLLLAVVILPALVTAVLSWVNPYDAVEISSEPTSGGSLRWGDHPYWEYECSDPACVRSTHSFSFWDSIDHRSVRTSDGTQFDVVRMDMDHPMIVRCLPRASACGSGREATKIEWPSVQPGSEKIFAIAAADDGRVWIAAAEQVDSDDPHPDVDTEIDLSVMACADLTCESRAHVPLGRVNGWLDNSDLALPSLDMSVESDFPIETSAGHASSDPEPGPPLEIYLDENGVPLVVYIGWANAALATCGMPDCTEPQLVPYGSGGTAVSPIGDFDDGVVDLDHGQMVTYCPGEECDQAGIEGVSNISSLLAVADSGVIAGQFGILAMLTEPADREGVHISINTPAPVSWRTVVLHCADYLCQDTRLIPLGLSDQRPTDPVLVVEPDGTVRLWYEADTSQLATFRLSDGH